MSARLKELEREVRELRRANEICGAPIADTYRPVLVEPSLAARQSVPPR